MMLLDQSGGAKEEYAICKGASSLSRPSLRGARLGRGGEVDQPHHAAEGDVIDGVPKPPATLAEPTRGTSSSITTTSSIRPPWRLTVCSSAQAVLPGACSQTTFSLPSDLPQSRAQSARESTPPPARDEAEGAAEDDEAEGAAEDDEDADLNFSGPPPRTWVAPPESRDPSPAPDPSRQGQGASAAPPPPPDGPFAQQLEAFRKQSTPESPLDRYQRMVAEMRRTLAEVRRLLPRLTVTQKFVAQADMNGLAGDMDALKKELLP